MPKGWLVLTFLANPVAMPSLRLSQVEQRSFELTQYPTTFLFSIVAPHNGAKKHEEFSHLGNLHLNE